MPRVPNIDQATIDPRKITHYLLELTHSEGGGKAAFLLDFGFKISEWQVLRDALLEHSLAYDYVRFQHQAYGRAYRVSGRLRSPDGRNPRVAVVWQIRHGENHPRLITAFPD